MLARLLTAMLLLSGCGDYQARLEAFCEHVGGCTCTADNCCVNEGLKCEGGDCCAGFTCQEGVCTAMKPPVLTGPDLPDRRGASGVYDFGGVPVRSSAPPPPAALTFSNTGAGDTLPLEVVAEPYRLVFPTDTSDCKGRVLAPGGSCTIRVWFEPQTEGYFNSTLIVYERRSHHSISVDLNGRTFAKLTLRFDESPPDRHLGSGEARSESGFCRSRTSPCEACPYGPTCDWDFRFGDPITLTAFGGTFVGWSGACTGTDRTCTLTLTGDVEAVAHLTE